MANKKKGGNKAKTPRQNNDNSKSKKGTSNEKGKKSAKNGSSSKVSAHDAKMAEIDNISLLNSPITCIATLVRVMFNLILGIPGFIWQNIIIFVSIPALILGFFYIDGPHDIYREEVKEFSYFASWWVGLGIASSVGLGTGLHTFVLYLGPYMAKVTMAANECNAMPVFVPNRWSYESFAPCEKWQGEPTIGVFEIYMALSIEAFLWGLGTAIGELPPYFVARAASIAGKKHEELAEIEDGINQNASLKDRLMGMLYSALKKRAFLVVFLCASIPNPAFDLAGLTCGHFLIPFWTFFIATAMGKACVKVTIQSFFTIIMFSAHMVNSIMVVIASISPDLEKLAREFLEKQKSKLYDSQDTNEEPALLAQIWNYLIMIMISYFIYAFLNAIVQNQLKYDEEVKAKKND